MSILVGLGLVATGSQLQGWARVVAAIGGDGPGGAAREGGKVPVADAIASTARPWGQTKRPRWRLLPLLAGSGRGHEAAGGAPTAGHRGWLASWPSGRQAVAD